jgi:Family of unknown function (DUF5330)
MFFLLRMAFWLCIVLALLPTDKATETDKSSPVAATDAFSAATAAVSDMTQFCTRQPTACEIGGQAATVVGHRAQAGAKKVYDFITEKKAPEITDKKPETTVTKEVIKEAPVKDFGGRQDIRSGKTKDAKKSQDHTGSIGPAVTEKHTAPSDTLTPQDFQLQWQFGWQAPII